MKSPKPTPNQRLTPFGQLSRSEEVGFFFGKAKRGGSSCRGAKQGEDTFAVVLTSSPVEVEVFGVGFRTKND